jgi:hypothetical protein
MKKIIFSSSLLILIFSFCWGQHVVFLKNGGILKGRVDGGTKDTLYLSLLGNKLKIAYNDINVVYFNDSMVSVNANYKFKDQVSVATTPNTAIATATNAATAAPQTAAAIATVPVATPPAVETKATAADSTKKNATTDTTATAKKTTAADTATIAVPAPVPVVTMTVPTPKKAPVADAKQEGKIKGIISYYITKNNISKPDSGAQVLIVDSINVPQFDIAAVDTFLFGSAYREIANQYKLTGDKVPDEITEQLKGWKVADDGAFDKVTQRADKNITLLKNSGTAQNITVDKDGFFNITTKAGIYYVLISSEKAKGNNLIEKEGKVFCKKIMVTKELDAIVKNSFDVY